MLELAILGLLKEHELHGYELKKRLSDTLGLASAVSFGSLYPALARLDKAGAVKAVEARESSVAPGPLTGSLGGELAVYRARKTAGRGARGTRGKKVYGITPRGEMLFEELLATESQSSDDDRMFNLRLAFAAYLPPDIRLGMLERRRAHLLDRLFQIKTRVKAVRDGYARSLMEHDRESAEHDLSWIDRLIASERAGDGPDRSAAPEPTPINRARQQKPVRPVQMPGANNPSLSGLSPATPQEDIIP
jgi:DNA-binding PadR family transcriptional regulator